MWIATRRRARRRGQHLSGQLRPACRSSTATTGECTASLPNVDQPLPDLDACAGQDYCHATVNRLDWDAASNSLYVAYITWVGTLSNNVETTWYLTRYNLASGGWAWTKVLQAEPGGGTVQGGFVTGWSCSMDACSCEGLPARPGRQRRRPEPPAVGEHVDRRDRPALEPVRRAGARRRRHQRAGRRLLHQRDPARRAVRLPGRRGPLDRPGPGAVPLHGVGRSRERRAGPGVDLLDAQAFARPDRRIRGRIGRRLPARPVDGHRAAERRHRRLAPRSVDRATPRRRSRCRRPGSSSAGDFQFVRGRARRGRGRADREPEPGSQLQIAVVRRSAADRPRPRAARRLADRRRPVLRAGEPGPEGRRIARRARPADRGVEAWTPDVDEPGLVETFAPDPATGEFWVGGSSIGIWGGPGHRCCGSKRPPTGPIRCPRLP